MMPYIKGTLVSTNKDWKYIYNSVLNFVNEEIQNAYLKAVEFYSDIKEEKLNYETVLEKYNDLIVKYNPSTYQKKLIHSSLFSGTNNYLYSPKKNNFKRFTNRSIYIDIGSVQISIDKRNCSVKIQTDNFENLDKYLVENTFLSEFINMVNTISWPTRQGPSTAVRGCILVKISKEDAVIFYKSGPRPPLIQTNNLKLTDTTLKEPSHLASKMLKSIRYVTTEVTDETSQPLPSNVKNDFDDF